MRWVRYTLDNFVTVKETVEGMYDIQRLLMVRLQRSQKATPKETEEHHKQSEPRRRLKALGHLKNYLLRHE